MDVAFAVETPHGVVEGKPGDYLCLDVMGKPYPCDAETFERSHTESVEGDTY